jgi:eukaryotic-like serine/threonine-protein kinase
MVNPLTPDDPPALGGFRLAGRLGEGGQGVVYLAHSGDGEPVAVKLLNAGDPETRARLTRELEALESIASFCTARVIDVSTGGARPYVVSEYVEGPSLAERVGERGPLRGGELERLVVGTATALAAIHAAGIVHRDFKPANVLLGPDGPRVVDFGIARAEGAATMTSGLIGTPAYLSPEQIGGTPAGPASDVFAWAASMVFAATGVSPFGAGTVPAVLHRVLYAEPDLSALPPRLREVIGASLAKDPVRRPTAAQLMVSLVSPGASPPYDGGPTGPQRPSETTGVTARGRSRGLLLAVVAVVMALGATGTTLFFLLNRSPVTTTTTLNTPPPPETVSVNPDLKIPAAFEGDWSGHINSTNPLSPQGAENRVKLEEGESTASWEEKNSGTECKADIILTKVERHQLTFSLAQMEGGCIPGTITLGLGESTLTYTWRDVPGLGLVTETGTLKKN